ncbi:MFS transporter [Butyrivibrio sp. AE3004]|uniref:MFS transporter n=1 Tax=Butyrivibrio sp. AE3004 TaxID=1506994 RepID=UPI000493F4F3|nr:MFS transporter [Butyrivibrio sp. AE3004]
MIKRRDTWMYLLILLLVAELAIVFISVMAFLNYRTSALNLEEQVISKIEKDTVTNLETAIGFGKSFENYYGMDEVFENFDSQLDGTVSFVIGKDGELMYFLPSDDRDVEKEINDFISSREFARKYDELPQNDGGIIKKGRSEVILTAIHQDEEILGYFGCLYSGEAFEEGFEILKKDVVVLSVIVGVIEMMVLAILVIIIRSDKFLETGKGKENRNFEKAITIIVMTISIIVLSTLLINRFQNDYIGKMEDSIKVTMQNLEDTIRRVQSQGVDLREVDDLKDYIEERVYSLTMIKSVRVIDHITEFKRTDEESDILSYAINLNEKDGIMLFLEAELSTEAMKKEMYHIVLVLLSTMIILMIFVFELNNITELLVDKFEKSSGKGKSFSEKQVGIALRFSGFLCSTAEYMCVPYAAMLIRESGESVFGLSVGMTAALPLTLEGLTQMISMLLLPRFVKKFNIRVMLIVSTILMIICNVTAFSMSTALIIILCRAVAGIAYAGFKQVSNYLITKGYETETGRSDNISQDNAGLLAGATCGAGLGAILSANTGYAMTFVFSACLFFAYLLASFFLLPWRALKEKGENSGEEEKPVKIGSIIRMIFSWEMLFYVVVIGIPLNIGVMLCVTLIPAICQTNGISSVMLSYCYIANGIAGIYIGPYLVSMAKKIFGIPLSIAFAFSLTAVSIFILKMPPLPLMIVITSMILGFLDGFATPMCTDQFMELKVVKKSVDESSALILSVVLSYVLLTFAPVIAELLLIPEKGVFSPMMIGAAVYAVAAVCVFFFKRKA